jgi:hypothetical protein
MARTFHRLKAIPDDAANSPLYLDVWLEDGFIDDEQPIFGFEGDLLSSGGHSVPFIIRRHGTVDFGSEGYPAEERNGTTNILDVEVKESQLITWIGHGYSATYRIAPVKDLA